VPTASPVLNLIENTSISRLYSIDSVAYTRNKFLLKSSCSLNRLRNRRSSTYRFIRQETGSLRKCVYETSCTKGSKTYNVISRVKVGRLYPADKASVFSTSPDRTDRVIRRRKRQLRTTWDFRVRSAYIPNVTRVLLRREYHKLVCWQYQFRNSVCAIYRTCSPRIAGTSNVPFRVSNTADQNHNLSVSIARRLWIRYRNHYREIECWA